MRKLLRDISGITGIKQRTRQFMVALKLAGDLEHTPSEEELAQAFSGTKLKHAVLVNLVIFGFMWAFGDWWWWFAFWALPLLTWISLFYGCETSQNMALWNFLRTHCEMCARPKRDR